MLEYFGTFWNNLEYFGIFWHILEFLEYFGIIWNILEYFGILGYFRHLLCTTVNLRLLRSILQSPLMLQLAGTLDTYQFFVCFFQ